MSVLQLVRHANRYREMLSILVKFGFREFFEDAKLDLLLERGHRLFSRGTQPEVETASRPARLRMALEELGPTFIKLGQILSTRPDILSPEYIEELQKLQADVPAVPWPEIKAQLEEDFEDLSEEEQQELTRNFDTNEHSSNEASKEVASEAITDRRSGDDDENQDRLTG